MKKEDNEELSEGVDEEEEDDDDPSTNKVRRVR